MTSKQFYKTSAWKWFSRYCLTFHSINRNGELWAICATSKRPYAINDRLLHCGHFIKVFDGNSTNFNTAFDERNVLPQSYAENHYMGGNPTQMRIAIDHIHGKGTADELYLKSKKPFEYIEEDGTKHHNLNKACLKAISDKYRIAYKALAKEKGDAWK